MKLEVSEEVQKRFNDCCKEIIIVIDEHMPEVRQSWDKKDPNSFEKRVVMTMYLEMIHAGFFNE